MRKHTPKGFFTLRNVALVRRAAVQTGRERRRERGREGRDGRTLRAQGEPQAAAAAAAAAAACWSSGGGGCVLGRGRLLSRGRTGFGMHPKPPALHVPPGGNALLQQTIPPAAGNPQRAAKSAWQRHRCLLRLHHAGTAATPALERPHSRRLCICAAGCRSFSGHSTAAAGNRAQVLQGQRLPRRHLHVTPPPDLFTPTQPPSSSPTP